MPSPRTTPEQVRGIAPGIPESVDLEPLINKAAIFIKRIEKNNTCGLDEEDLQAIECFLVAHFYYVDPSNQILQSKTVGRSSESYQQRTSGSGFRATPFGEQAIQLDCTGTLRANITAGVHWLGTDACPEEY